MTNAKGVRASLHDAIQGTVDIDEDLPEGAMLTGWCAIAEWMAPDGNRWLSIVDGNANGDGLARWQQQGYLHNALFDPDGFVPDSDEGDGDGS